jgi:hypothetical protein
MQGDGDWAGKGDGGIGDDAEAAKRRPAEMGASCCTVTRLHVVFAQTRGACAWG